MVERYIPTQRRDKCSSLEDVLSESTATYHQAAQLSSVLAREAQDTDDEDDSATAITEDSQATPNLGTGPLPPGWIMQRTKNGR
jgi:hypothetical protein